MRKSTIAITMLVAITLACSVLTPPVTLTPAATLTPTATRTPATIIKVVRVHFTEITSTTWEQLVATGATAILEALFEPQLYREDLEADMRYLFTGTWESPDIAGMRYCFSTSGTCQPEGDWLPYAEKKEFPILVDWLGKREFRVAVEFRDSSGNAIITDDGSYDLQSVTRLSTEVSGFWDVATPIGNQPAAVQTALAPTLAAYPVIGSVVLNDGNCCTGGKAGSTIGINVEFAATSIYGKVTEMRVGTDMCFAETDPGAATWEPFATSKTIQVYVTINWTGFYVGVQYRDEQGNLSPVYCDDISVEGMP